MVPASDEGGVRRGAATWPDGVLPRVAGEGVHSDRPWRPVPRVAVGCADPVGVVGVVDVDPGAAELVASPAEAPGRRVRCPPGATVLQCGLSPLWGGAAPAWSRDPDHRRLTLRTYPCGGLLRAVAASSCRRGSVGG